MSAAAASGAEASLLKRPRFEIDAVQRKHRQLVRRQRARHALERLEVDAAPARAAAAKEAAALAQERVWEAEDELAAAESTVPRGSSKLDERRKRLHAAKEELASAQAAAARWASVEASNADRMRYLVTKHSQEVAALVFRMGAELKGRHVIAEAQALEARAAAAERRANRHRIRRAEREAAGAEAGEDGSGEDGSDAEHAQQGGGDDDDDDLRVGETRAQRDARRARDEARKAEERALRERIVLATVDFAYATPCMRCGSHTTRNPPFIVCGECKRELCGRGGASIQHPGGLPCVDVYKCHCGMNLCHDCYVGAEQRGTASWRPCAVCESWMCGKEVGVYAAECKRCGLDPLCRPCRGPHEAWCRDTNATDGDRYYESDE